MRKFVTVIMMMALYSGAAFAAFSTGDAGTSTAQFLKLGAGARAAGMGEAYGSVTDDSASVYWNPAGLSRLKGPSLSLMHAVWFEDIAYDWFSYAQPVAAIGTVGVGVQYLSYGSVKGTDTDGNDTGDFSPNDLAVALSYSRMVRGVALGMNVKYILSKIKNSASAWAVDLGAQYPLSGKVMLGAALQNFGTKMKFASGEDPLPLNVKAGGSCLIKQNWLATLDVNAPVDNEVTLAAGTEYVYPVSRDMSVAGRLGYNTLAKETGGLNGLSAGVGVGYLTYSIDYAFVPYGDLGNTHRISFGMRF